MGGPIALSFLLPRPQVSSSLSHRLREVQLFFDLAIAAESDYCLMDQVLVASVRIGHWQALHAKLDGCTLKKGTTVRNLMLALSSVSSNSRPSISWRAVVRWSPLKWRSSRMRLYPFMSLAAWSLIHVPVQTVKCIQVYSQEGITSSSLYKWCLRETQISHEGTQDSVKVSEPHDLVIA